METCRLPGFGRLVGRARRDFPDVRQARARSPKVPGEIVVGPSKRHKTLIFDLGRVLVYFDFARAYRAFEPFCPYLAPEMPKRLFTTDLVQRLETGRLPPRDFHAGFSQLIGLDLDYDRFCAT